MYNKISLTLQIVKRGMPDEPSPESISGRKNGSAKCEPLASAACRNLYTVKYIRLPDLLNELAIARGEGCYMDVMKFYRKVSLLILDEWMLIPLTKTESRDLLEIVEARYERSSTIFCSQFAPPGWHERIAEDALADAVLDRIENSSYKILFPNNTPVDSRP